MPAKQADRCRLATEDVRGARHVQPLPAGRCHQTPRPMDVPLDEAIDLEQLVDRRVRGETDDHAAAPSVNIDLR